MLMPSPQFTLSTSKRYVRNLHIPNALHIPVFAVRATPTNKASCTLSGKRRGYTPSSSNKVSKWDVPNLLRVLAVGDAYAEWRAVFFGGVLVELLRGFGGVVVAPEPGHFGGEFGGAVGGVMSAAAEAEMEVVPGGL